MLPNCNKFVKYCTKNALFLKMFKPLFSRLLLVVTFALCLSGGGSWGEGGNWEGEPLGSERTVFFYGLRGSEGAGSFLSPFIALF